MNKFGPCFRNEVEGEKGGVPSSVGRNVIKKTPLNTMLIGTF